MAYYPAKRAYKTGGNSNTVIEKLPRFTPPGGWNQEFQAVYNFIANGQGNACIEAVAGGGKTTALVEGIIRYSEANPTHRILFVAFNVSIKEEGAKRLAGYKVDVLTCHGLGFRSLRKPSAWGGKDGRQQFDVQTGNGPYMRALAENELGPEKEKADDREALLDLISKAKMTLTDTVPGMIELMDRFGIISKYDRKDFCSRAIKLMEFTAKRPGMISSPGRGKGEGKMFSKTVITFDDEIWLPIVNNWSVDQYDAVFVDECQDLSKARRELIKRSLRPNARMFIVGDRMQCVSKDTLVRTSSTKEEKVSNLKAGDKVLSWRNGKIVSQTVKHIVKSDWSWGYKITLKSGKTLSMSPNHRIWASEFSLKKNETLVYLMYRSDLGFRVGITNKYTSDLYKLGTRAVSEQADKLWILKVCENREDALYYELCCSLEFGIPTCVFSGKHRGLNQDRINDVFDNFGMNGVKLLENNNLSFDLPHWISRGITSLSRPRAIIHLYAHGNRGNTVSVEWSENNLHVKQDLEAAGFKINPAKKENRFRIRYSSTNYREALSVAKKINNIITNSFINEKIYTPNGCYNLLTASSLHKGMNISVYNGNSISCEEIISIEKIEDEFYDIDVDDASNFFGNDILSHNSIYAFAGADIESLQSMAEEFNCTMLPLSCSWRCDDLIVREAQQFNPIITSRPNASDGIVDKCKSTELLELLSPGDVLLSRTNAPLVRVFFQLAKQQRKVKFIGRDYGKMLAYRIKSWKFKHEAKLERGEVYSQFTGNELLSYNDEWFRNHTENKSESDYKVASDRLRDEYETVMALVCDLRSSLNSTASVQEVLDRCNAFSPEENKEDKDGKEHITLSSTHRFKGLERDHAYILIDTYKPGADQEETNLTYVATTRAKKHLTYVVGKPGVSGAQSEEDEELE